MIGLRSMSDDLPQRIAVGLTKIGLALRQQSWQEAGGRGMSPTQGQILATLAGGAALRPGEVAARLAISAPTVSDSVRVLEGKGLLERVADPRDARATLLRLTPKGRREATRASG